MSRVNGDNKKASGNKLSFRSLVHIFTLFFKFSSFCRKKCWIASKTHKQFTVIQSCTLLYIVKQHYSVILSTNLNSYIILY